MHTTTTHDIATAIGAELRSARKERGLSQVHLAARLGSGIRGQTVATYEAGTRQCTVARFVEICTAIGISPPTVLHAALRRADRMALPITVDLPTILADRTPELEPLRHWARNLTRTLPKSTSTVRLEPIEVIQLGVFCDLTHQDMVHRLLEFTPATTPEPTYD